MHADHLAAVRGRQVERVLGEEADGIERLGRRHVARLHDGAEASDVLRTADTHAARAGARVGRAGGRAGVRACADEGE